MNAQQSTTEPPILCPHGKTDSFLNIGVKCELNGCYCPHGRKLLHLQCPFKPNGENSQ